MGIDIQESKRQKAKKHRSKRRRRPKSWCLVYALREAPGGPVFYVGQTRSQLSVRLKYHLKALDSDLKTGRKLSQFRYWLFRLRESGKSPLIDLITDDGATIGSDCHKTSMSQRKLARKSDDQIQSDRKDDIDQNCH